MSHTLENEEASQPPVGLHVPSSHTVVATGALSDGHVSSPWLPWGTRSTMKCTNAFVWDPATRRVLLGWKKRGFGADLYNGFGGKKEPQETIDEAALRELQEEAGISSPLQHAGILLFVVGPETPAFEVHVYSATSWEGEPTEYAYLSLSTSSG